MSSEIDDLREFNERVADGASRTISGNKVSHDSYGDSPSPVDLRSKAQVVNAQMWAIYGSNNFSPCEKAVAQLPPAQYTIEVNDSIGIHFRKTDVNIDELIELPDSASAAVIAEIEHFWTKEAHFRKFGFLWKRGVMMWGPPGSGKTSTLQTVSKKIVEKGGISVYVTRPSLASKGLKLMRQVEPNRPIVVMLEDIDAIIEDHGESDLLAMLDGELQIDNVVFVATTNYPERLDKRFINRPSRFDIVRKIGMPNDEARGVYLKTKNPRLQDDPVELSEWVSLTKGFSVAHLKELIVSVEVFDVNVKDAVARLKTMMDYKPTSTDDTERRLGFTR